MSQPSTSSEFDDIERRLFGAPMSFKELVLKELLDTEACGRAALAVQDYTPPFEETDCAIRKSR